MSSIFAKDKRAKTPARKKAGGLRRRFSRALSLEVEEARPLPASADEIEARRDEIEQARFASRKAHTVTWFHDVTHPQSHLGAQVLTRLVRTYEINLCIKLVSPWSDEADAEHTVLMASAIKDAKDLAQAYNLDFDPESYVPTVHEFELAGRLLGTALDQGKFEELAPAIGTALWSGGKDALLEIDRTLPAGAALVHEGYKADGDEALACLDYRSGSILTYGGEIYPAIDRLYHLEERLVALGVRNAWSAPRLTLPHLTEGAEPLARPARDLSLELFISLENPQDWLAVERASNLAVRLGLTVSLRPVLAPGTALSQAYQVFDVVREAGVAGIEFNPAALPSARALEDIYALYPLARRQGLGDALLVSCLKGIYTDGLNVGKSSNLREIVERAGLDWQEAQAHQGSDDWRLEFESNRVDLIQLGTSQTPTFRISGGDCDEAFITCGQDRLWLVERDIMSRSGKRKSWDILAG